MGRLLAKLATWTLNRARVGAVLSLLLASLLVPDFALAACSQEGYTVIFVNGILNSIADAQASKDDLVTYLPSRISSEPIQIISGYNATHLDGWGDKIQSLFQALNRPVSQFDLNTILIQIHPEVTTRKILLVGHSQGSFYTNELYEYLIAHGVPKESIAVYNIATPASFVAGGGQYITSTNDKVINYVRDTERAGNTGIYANSYYTVGGAVATALRANVTIIPEVGYESNAHGGHALSVYLDGEAPRIVNEISNILKKLKSTGEASAGGCFIPPADNISYKMQAAAFAAADPMVTAIHFAGEVYSEGIFGIVQAALGTRGVFALSNEGNNNSNQVAAAAMLSAEVKSEVDTPAIIKSIPQEQPSPADVPLQDDSVPIPLVKNEQDQKIVPLVETAHVPVPDAPSLPLFSPLSQPIQPGYGGGGGSAPAKEVSAVQSTAVSLDVRVPTDNSYSATTSVNFSGTATAGAIVSIAGASASTTVNADGSGNWSGSLEAQDGSHTFTIQAASSGVKSIQIERLVIVDTSAPAAPSLSSQDCDASLVTGVCVLPSISVNLSWSDVPGAAYFGISKDGVVVATTTATSSVQNLATNATTSFAVVSYDMAENHAMSSTLEIVSVTNPLVFNEIAWGGTDTMPTDQWIELKNISPYVLNLSRFVIAREGETDIPLSGTIPPVSGNFAVVEPRSIPFTGTRKIVTPFSLSTAGDKLNLKWGNETVDSTPGVAMCGGWCAGSLITSLGSNEQALPALRSPLSMERTSDTSSGALAASWHSTDSYGPWLGVGGGLWGTPGESNTSGLPEAGVYCGTKSNLIKNGITTFNPSTSGCVYLSKFITGSTYGAIRYGGLYRGTVSSSTVVSGHQMGKALAYSTSDTLPADAQAGENYFFAMWESRNGDAFMYDSKFFNVYFTEGASSTLGVSGPPHGNYVTLPFTYQP